MLTWTRQMERGEHANCCLIGPSGRHSAASLLSYSTDQEWKESEICRISFSCHSVHISLRHCSSHQWCRSANRRCFLLSTAGKKRGGTFCLKSTNYHHLPSVTRDKHADAADKSAPYLCSQQISFVRFSWNSFNICISKTYKYWIYDIWSHSLPMQMQSAVEIFSSFCPLRRARTRGKSRWLLLLRRKSAALQTLSLPQSSSVPRWQVSLFLCCQKQKKIKEQFQSGCVMGKKEARKLIIKVGLHWGLCSVMSQRAAIHQTPGRCCLWPVWNRGLRKLTCSTGVKRLINSCAK